VKYIDEFRDPKLAASLLADIHARMPDRPPDNPLKLMEVCGGHTHAIHRAGLPSLLPDSLELVHGPGCPVCVTPTGRIDDAVVLASEEKSILCTFGDAARAPGSKGSLLDAKATGADVRVVYSPLDALALAETHPDREVVFFAVGFETTAPAVAATIVRARRQGIPNFSVLSNHVLVVPGLKAILARPGSKLEGFIGPGHVSCTIGSEPYRFIPEEHGLPIVISGFEPLDLLQALLMLLDQLTQGRCEVENQYQRAVQPHGNPTAKAIISQVFTARPHFAWRGLGPVPGGGLRLRDEFAAFDAEERFSLPGKSVPDPKACRCGEVLVGAKKPWECGAFATRCTPENPLGACMVSSEGACAASYAYEHRRQVSWEKATG